MLLNCFSFFFLFDRGLNWEGRNNSGWVGYLLFLTLHFCTLGWSTAQRGGFGVVKIFICRLASLEHAFQKRGSGSCRVN